MTSSAFSGVRPKVISFKSCSAYRRFVDYLGVFVVRLYRRDGAYTRLIHNNGVALDMSRAACVADRRGVEQL